jgi:hypothetical protein
MLALTVSSNPEEGHSYDQNEAREHRPPLCKGGKLPRALL